MKNELEIRPAKPLEIPVCEILLPLSPEWIQFIRTYELDISKDIEMTVGTNTNQLDGPFVRKYFPELWRRNLRDLVPVRRKEYTSHLVLTMRQRSWECVREAAQSVGCTAQEVAWAIIASHLQIRGLIASGKTVTIAVSTAALDALEAAGVSVEEAALAGAPHSAECIPFRVESWFGRAAKGSWNSRKLLDWMKAAKTLRKIKFSLPAWQYEMIEVVAAGIGITPEEWFLKSIGYRAFREMRKPQR